MADNDLRELSFETAFAYQEQLDLARRAVMRAAQGILPPQASRDGLEYFASQWLRQQGDVEIEVLQDAAQFNDLVDTALGVVQGFHTPAPRATFMRTVAERDDTPERVERRVSRKMRDLCSKLGVPCDFDDESELIEWLLTNKRYQTWLTYAKSTGEGTIGEEIPRGKPDLQQWMENRKQDLRTAHAA